MLKMEGIHQLPNIVFVRSLTLQIPFTFPQDNIIVPDKWGYYVNIFLIFLWKTYVVDTHWTFLKSISNISWRNNFFDFAGV